MTHDLNIFNKEGTYFCYFPDSNKSTYIYGYTYVGNTNLNNQKKNKNVKKNNNCRNGNR